MGLFLDNHENYKDYKERTVGTNAQFGSYTINSGRPDYAAWGIQLGTSSLFTLMNKIGEGKDGKGGKDDGETISPEKKALLDKLDDVYSKYGVKNADGMQKKVNKYGKQIANYTEEITKSNQKFDKKIADIDAEISKLKGTNTDTNTSSKIEELESEKNKLTQEKKAEEEKLQNKIEEAQREQAIYQTGLGEVQNIQLQIERLEDKEAGKDITYDIKKETDDLVNFNKALVNFKKNATIETAKALEEAYRGGDNGVNNPTAKKAWEMVKDQVNKLLQKADNGNQKQNNNLSFDFA